MLKSGNSNHSAKYPESHPAKPDYVGALASGLNRRAFLRQTTAALLVAGIAGCKPNVSEINSQTKDSTAAQAAQPSASDQKFEFTQHQKQTIEAVQSILFPNDGDGPSANQLNGLAYLEWALTDPDNSADGDGEFMVKGVGWLDSLSEQTQGDQFIKLKLPQQNKILEQISQSSTGESWMSLLVYYLIEALVMDPIYGGNPNQIGWKWLKHQPGFPRPTSETLYRHFS